MLKDYGIDFSHFQYYCFLSLSLSLSLSLTHTHALSLSLCLQVVQGSSYSRAARSIEGCHEAGHGIQV